MPSEAFYGVIMPWRSRNGNPVLHIDGHENQVELIVPDHLRKPIEEADGRVVVYGKATRLGNTILSVEVTAIGSAKLL